MFANLGGSPYDFLTPDIPITTPMNQLHYPYAPPMNYRNPMIFPQKNNLYYGNSPRFNNAYAPFPNPYAREYFSRRIQIHRLARMLFDRYDRFGFGRLEVSDLFRVVSDIFAANDFGPVSRADIVWLMRVFDVDGDGKIDFFEFEMMLDAMFGYNMNPELVRQYRMM